LRKSQAKATAIDVDVDVDVDMDAGLGRRRQKENRREGLTRWRTEEGMVGKYLINQGIIN